MGGAVSGNVQVFNGHRITFSEVDGRYCWECLTCSSAGSTGDELSCEVRAEKHTSSVGQDADDPRG